LTTEGFSSISKVELKDKSLCALVFGGFKILCLFRDVGILTKKRRNYEKK